MKNEKMEKMIKEWKTLGEDYGKTLNEGVKKVLISYNYSTEYQYLLIDDGWEKNAQQMIDFIKECGIKSFMFNDTSTEATKLLKIFIKNGYQITGTVPYIRAMSEEEALYLELKQEEE